MRKITGSTLETRQCPTCGGEFDCTHVSKQRYCCNKCNPTQKPFKNGKAYPRNLQVKTRVLTINMPVADLHELDSFVEKYGSALSRSDKIRQYIREGLDKDEDRERRKKELEL